MKKILLIAVVLLMTSALAFAGGGKDKGGAAAGGGEPPFFVDLKTIILAETSSSPDKVVRELGNFTKNQKAITRTWEDILFIFPENFVDISKYQRVTITLKYYDKDNKELEPADSMGLVTFLKKLDGDWRGPAMGPGPNTPMKEMNVGGFSGLVNKERGVRHGCSEAPAALLIQRAQDARVAFIEVGTIVFHNGNFKFTDPQPEGVGPQ